MPGGKSKAVDLMVNFVPAQVLASDYEASSNRIQRPNESREYRDARSSLLAEEIELRRHIALVAAMRRDLPPGSPHPANGGRGHEEKRYFRQAP